MRALMVLCALVATPLVMAVAQGLPGRSSCANGSGRASRSLRGTAQAHQGLCVPTDPQDPPPPPPPPPPTPEPTGCVNSSSSVGTASVRGQVFVDQSPWPYLAGWCVEVLDANGAVVATGLSTSSALDGEGNNFAIGGLAAGMYTVCEVLQTGYSQSYPTFGESCGSGRGYAVTVTDGASASFIWFGNLPQ